MPVSTMKIDNFASEKSSVEGLQNGNASPKTMNGESRELSSVSSNGAHTTTTHDILDQDHLNDNSRTPQETDNSTRSPPDGIENGNAIGGGDSMAMTSPSSSSCSPSPPERSSREQSTDRKTSFSYLSLLTSDGSFPHRTTPLGDPQTRRKSSLTSSQEYIWKTKNTNYMARSNPIGLAEPSQKRDGYAVGSLGSGGSLYRSTEQINAPQIPGSGKIQTRPRASSATPEGSGGGGGGWKRQGKSSSLNSSTGMIRFGSGLISTGKVAAPSSVGMNFMPFGTSTLISYSKNTSAYKGTKTASKGKKTEVKTSSQHNVTAKSQQNISKVTASSQHSHSKVTTSLQQSHNKVTTSSQQSHCKVSTSSQQSHNHCVTSTAIQSNKKESSTKTKEAEVVSSFTIEEGIREIQKLTAEASSSSTVEEGTVGFREVTTTRSQQQSHEVATTGHNWSHLSTTGTTTGTTNSSCTFGAVDVEMRGSLGDQCQEKEEAAVVANFTVKRKRPPPTQRRRMMSFSAGARVELPEQQVTISLPASRRASRNPSVDRERRPSTMVKKGLRSSNSVEIFNGVYQMKVSLPKPSISTTATSAVNAAQITEVKSSFVAAATDNESPKDDLILNEKNQEPEVHTIARDESGKLALQRSVSRKGSQRGSRKASKERTSLGEQNGAKLEASKSDNPHGAGEALKGLSAALENLQQTQQTQKMRLLNHQKTSSDDGNTVSVVVSLPPSRRGSKQASRAGSPDRNSSDSGIRSRRNSMDLYSGEYNVKLAAPGRNRRPSAEQTSACHIRCDDSTKDGLGLCARCHEPGHATRDCREFQELFCPRCLEWDHWEDTCPSNAFGGVGGDECSVCGAKGHATAVHNASKFKQRRSIVDTIGWQPFTEWFYESTFRSWWQLNGCVGVPLYKIYRRADKVVEWRSEMPPLPIEEPEPEPEPEPKKFTSRFLKKADSVEELMKSYYSDCSTAKSAAKCNGTTGTTGDSEEADSGRSTPEYLKKYPGTSSEGNNEESCDDDNTASCAAASAGANKRLRTFSETLRMLDDDIVAELNVK